jgi:hypothetical protein
MDPDNPVRPVNDVRLTHVQRWVMSVLTAFTIAHLCVGIDIAAVAAPVGQAAPRVGLTIIAGLFGVVGIVAAQLIHRRNPLNAWLLLALFPTAVGLVLVLR